MLRDTAKGPFPWNKETPSKRRYRRWSVEMPTYIDVGGATHYSTITDISPDGARLRLMEETEIAVGTEVSVDLEGYRVIRAEVRHNAGGILGLMFLHDETDAVALARWMVEKKPPRRQTRHECHIEATLNFLGIEVACVVTDISRTGATISIEETGNLVISSEVLLKLPGHSSIAASVRHVEGTSVGLMLIDGYQGELPPIKS